MAHEKRYGIHETWGKFQYQCIVIWIPHCYSPYHHYVQKQNVDCSTYFTNFSRPTYSLTIIWPVLFLGQKYRARGYPSCSTACCSSFDWSEYKHKWEVSAFPTKNHTTGSKGTYTWMYFCVPFHTEFWINQSETWSEISRNAKSLP